MSISFVQKVNLKLQMQKMLKLVAVEILFSVWKVTRAHDMYKI